MGVFWTAIKSTIGTALTAAASSISSYISLIKYIGIAAVCIGLYTFYNHYNNLVADRDSYKLHYEGSLIIITDLEKANKIQKESCEFNIEDLKNMLLAKAAREDVLKDQLSQLEDQIQHGFPDVVQPSVENGKVKPEEAKCATPPVILSAINILRNNRSEDRKSGSPNGSGTNP